MRQRQAVPSGSPSPALRHAQPDAPHPLSGWTWHARGDTYFAAVLEDVSRARFSVRLETYIFEAAGIGLRLRDALIAAAQRGVRVHVLVDGFGSKDLPSSFWDGLQQAGGRVRIFNPLRLDRMGIRDHRKLLICDDDIAFVGGYNIAPDYEGDGVHRGWRDVALRVTGPLAALLGLTFDRMYAAAAFRRKRFIRLRRASEKRTIGDCGCEILLSGPGWGGTPLQRRLRADLAGARSVRILVAYFLPTRRLWRAITRAARAGARVDLIVPGQSDVPLSKLATESLYRRLLHSGARIFEYQPQMLHGKLLIVDDVVYVGSSNLDPRSLRVNYELMLRIESAELADAARALFEDCLHSAREVRWAAWRRQRSLWARIKHRFAHVLMARLDPWVALSQWKALPD